MCVAAVPHTSTWAEARVATGGVGPGPAVGHDPGANGSRLLVKYYGEDAPALLGRSK